MYKFMMSITVTTIPYTMDGCYPVYIYICISDFILKLLKITNYEMARQRR
jgi:hypothetical protein